MQQHHELSERPDLEMQNMSLRHKQEEILLQLKMNERKMLDQQQPQREKQQRPMQALQPTGFHFKERGAVQSSSGRQSQRDQGQFGGELELLQGSAAYPAPQPQRQHGMAGYGQMDGAQRGGHGMQGFQERGNGGDHTQGQMQMYRPSSPTGSGRSGGEQREVQSPMHPDPWGGRQQQWPPRQPPQPQQHPHLGLVHGDATGDGWYGKGQGSSSSGGGTGKGRGAEEMGGAPNRRPQQSGGYQQ